MQNSMELLIENFLRARRVSTPFIAINTTDPIATQQRLKDAILADAKKGGDDAPPMIQWDIAAGFSPLNQFAQSQIAKVQNENIGPIKMPDEAMTAVLEFVGETVVFAHGMNRLLNSQQDNAAVVIQSVLNIREEFKKDMRTLVLMSPIFAIPIELEQDIMVLDEPLPNHAELRDIVNTVVSDTAKQDSRYEGVSTELIEEAASALKGLNAFAAGQTAFMSLRKGTIDIPTMWIRKESAINQVPGLSVWKGEDRFVDIGGYDAVKSDLLRLGNGPEKPGLIAWADEFEKANSGVGTSLDGTATTMNGLLLDFMNRRCIGIIAVGVPGSGKSATAQAFGNEINCMTIKMDVAKMKGSLVGQSEENMGRAIKVMDAISEGQIFIFATCNSLANLSPEMQRRFMSTYYFGLPTKEERKTIWQLKLQQFGHTEDRSWIEVDDEGWTGAEIHKACRIAWSMRMSVLEGAERVVPMCVSNPGRILELEQQAHNTFLNAAAPGVYKMRQDKESAISGSGRQQRRVNLGD